jgi:hypothetical protein
MENISEIYYKELFNTKEPGILLLKMVLELFDNAFFSKQLLSAINKSISVYGRYNTYWVLLKLTEFKSIDFNKYLYPLFSTIILNDYRKKRNSSNIAVSEDFSEETRKILNKINKTRSDNLELENPFDD